MEALMLIKSAIIPVSIAPMTYPRSLQSLKMPILSALSCGFVFSASVAKNVGYTIAVPQPKMQERITKWDMVSAQTKTIKAMACKNIPTYSICFLQDLSVILPVNNWPIPQTAGYVAVTITISPMVKSLVARFYFCINSKSFVVPRNNPWFIFIW